jgi:hypothetical protein
MNETSCCQGHDRHGADHSADHTERGFAQRGTEARLTDDRRGRAGPVRIVEFEPVRDVECEAHGDPEPQAKEQRWAPET